MTTKQLTVGATTFYLDTTRLERGVDAVKPVLKGFAAVPAKYCDDSHTWQGDRVSSGFPPLDSLISVLTSTKFEAYLYTALELALYAVVVTLYLAVESAVMAYESKTCQALISSVRGSERYRHIAFVVKATNAELSTQVATIKTNIKELPAKGLKMLCAHLDRQVATA